MAWSTVSTEIQNPAGKRSNHMTAKQIRYFESKRQKAALKAKRKKSAHRHSAKKHRARTKKTNAAPRKKARKSTARHAAKRKHSHRSKPRRRNPGPELVAFVTGNSATKGRHRVAHSKKRRKSSARRSNAGTRRVSRKGRRHSSLRRNPAGISVKEMAYGGVGVLGGFFGSAALPQMFLGTGNTGMTGYAVTAAAAIGLTILTHMVFPRERALTFGVAAGGAANLLRRIITDQTPFGGYLSGMGDYMVANWGPPIMNDGLNSPMASVATNGAVMASSGISALDYADVRGGGSRPC